MVNIITKKTFNYCPSKYHILGLIGQGNYGRVFCAMELKTRKLFALKYLNPQQFSTHKFLRELRFLLTIKHPNIVPCHTIEYTNKGRYLVMDYCESGTLRNLIEFQKLSIFTSLEIIAELLSALEFCHTKGLIHCDIKPENILLNIRENGWCPRLSDFGISRLINDSNYSYSTYIGSPAYMAPERFYGHYSVKSDLYAMGVLLYELIMGERPFSGTYQELLKAHLNEPVKIPETVPFLIKTILNRALQKLPQNRFNSAAEMLNSLKLALEVEKASGQQTLLFYPSQIQLIASNFETKDLQTKIQHLTINENIIYQISKHKLTINQLTIKPFTLEEKYKINLSSPLHSFQSKKNSVFVILKNENKYCFYKFFKDKIDYKNFISQPIFSLKTDQLLTAIAPNEKWLVLAKTSKNCSSTQVQILKLPDFQPINKPLICPFPTHLFTLDNRHGVVIFNTQEKTHFQIFNRRGNWLQCPNIPLHLTHITSNLINPYFLLAIETNENQGLIINLKTFSLNRISIDIKPNFVIPTPWGFTLTDENNQIVSLNHEGEIISRFEVEGKITAIAPYKNEHLLIIEETSTEKKYYNFVTLKKLI